MTENIPGIPKAATFCREVNGFTYTLTEAHPEAVRYPWMPDDELLELAADIAENGQAEPVLLLPDGRILDGRNRELACAVAGVEPEYRTVFVADDEIRGFVRRRNVLRRHLSRELRRELIADALKEDPSQSNRAVARETGASDNTVAAVRRALESTAQIAQLAERTGADGRKRTATPKPKKPDRTTAEVATDDVQDGREAATAVPIEPPHPFAELMNAVTALTAAVTRAIRNPDGPNKRLREYLSYAGMVDNGSTTDAAPEFIWLRGVHHLIDLAGVAKGKPKTEAEIKRIWESHGLPPHPEMLRIIKAKRARKGGST